MKLGTLTAAAILLAWPPAAFALATESFGNDPMPKQPEWAEGVVDVVNLKSRVYSFWVNGNESFFYRGNVRDLNEALRVYATVKDEARPLLLLPGSGTRQSFDNKMIEFDWQLHVPSGIYRAMSKRTHAVLTVYINALKPKPLDRKRVEALLKDLNSETFKVREKAQQELQKLGNAAKPFLREALKAQSTLEGRLRIEALLDRLRDFDVTDLEIPKGLTVSGVGDQVAAGLKGLKDANRDVRSLAMHDLLGLAPYSDKVVPAFVELLQNDKDDHVRRTAAACLAHLDGDAPAVAAALKKALNDPDAYIRDACQRGLDHLANRKDTPEQQARLERGRALAKEIDEFAGR
jgi:hypothetical protein